MKMTHQLVHAVAVLGMATFICAVSAIAQECPDFVSSLDLGCYAHDVALSPGYAHVACVYAGLVVVDMSIPSLPVEMGSLGFDYSEYIAVHGTHAFVTDSGDEYPFGQVSLDVIDISTPSSPIRVGYWESTPGVLLGPVTAIDGYTFVVRVDEVLVIDVSVPSDPTYVGNLTIAGIGNVRDLAVAGDYAYVLFRDGLFVFDISDPTQPVPLGEYLSGGGHCDYAHLAVDMTGYASLTEWCFDGSHPPGWGLDVVDVSNPNKPINVGYFRGDELDSLDDLHDVAVSGGYSYVTLTENGDGELWVIDGCDPSQPDWAGSGNSLGSADNVAVGGGYAVIADGDAGLMIFRECAAVFTDGFESGDTSAWSSTLP